MSTLEEIKDFEQFVRSKLPEAHLCKFRYRDGYTEFILYARKKGCPALTDSYDDAKDVWIEAAQKLGYVPDWQSGKSSL